MADARLQLIIDVVGNVGRQLDQVAADLKKVTAEADKLAQTTDKLGRQGAQNISKLDAALKKAEVGFQRLNTAGQQFVGTGARIAAIGAGLAAGGLFPVKVASDFEAALKGVVAVTDGARENYEALSEEAKRLGRTSAFTATQAAEGFKLLGQAGLDAEQAIVALEPALNLAAAGGLELAESADISTNVLKGFGLEAEDLTRVTDVLANTATSANTNIRDLGQAMSFAAPAAKSAGVSLELASAAVGVLGDAGIQATRAGTGLRAILTRLSDPKIQAKLEQLGVSVQETADGSLDLINVFEQIGTKVEERTFGLAEATEIFGRNFSTTSLVLAESVERLKELNTANAAAEGTAKRTADTILEGLGGAFIELRSAVEGLLIEIGEPLLGALESIVDNIKEVVLVITEWVKANPQLASAIFAVVGAIGTILAVIGTLTIAIGGLLQVVAFAGAGFLKFVGFLRITVNWLKVTRLEMAATTVTARGLAAAFGVIALAVASFVAGWQLGRIINDMKVWEDSTSTVGDVIQFTFGNIEAGIIKLQIAYENLKITIQDFLGLDISDNVAEIERLERELEVVERTIDSIIEEGENRGKVPIEIEPKFEPQTYEQILAEVEQKSAESSRRAGEKIEENVVPAWARGAEFAGLFIDKTEEAAQAVGEFETFLVEVNGELREFTFPKVVAEETNKAAEATKAVADATKQATDQLPAWAQGAEFAGLFVDKTAEATDQAVKFQDVVVQVGDKLETFQLPETVAQSVDQVTQKTGETADALGNVKNIADQLAAQGIDINVLIANYAQVASQLAELVKPETKEVTVRVREERAAATGGLIERMLSIGGRLAGYGGGDRIRALLEAGEYVVRKEAVRKYGVGFMNAVNTMSLNMNKIPGMVTAQLGGMIPSPRFAYQTGGQVSTGLDLSDFGTVELQVGGQGFPVLGTRSTVEELKTVLKRESLVRSN